MSSVLRSLIVLAFCVLLPLQAVAGLLMPFCGGEPESAPSAHCDAGGPAHDENLVDAGAFLPHPADAGDPGAAASACDQCALCHLACTGALPMFVPEVSALLRSVLRAAPQSSVTHFRPDPFLRPPRSGLV